MQENNSTVSDVIRFVFPESLEYCLYALAAVQSFAMHYDRALERVAVLKRTPEAARKMQLVVRCDQKFWHALVDSFPPGTILDVPGSTPTDDMLIDFSEQRIREFDERKGYSVQWVMGQIAGTRPQMLPYIKQLPKSMVDPMPFVEGMLTQAEIGEKYRFTPANAGPLSLERMIEIVQSSNLVVARQSFLTVLSAALGIKTVEVTRDASLRPFLALKHYVQVSRLQPEQFFWDALNRGVEWLKSVSISMSSAPVATEPSAESIAPQA